MTRSSLEIGNSNQELMEKPGQRRWRIWLASGGILLVVAAMIVAAVLLLTQGDAAASGGSTQELREAISLEEVMLGKLIPSRFNATWISDFELVYPDLQGNLILYNAQLDTKKVVLSRDHPVFAISFDQQLSSDKKYLLLAYNFRKIYRHSFSAQYFAVSLTSNEQVPIVPEQTEAFLDLAVWGPQGNSIAFVYQNNIYYKKTVSSAAVKLTEDGIPGTIYNGVPDWVYEEEVLGSNKALWFSGDGSYMAFGTFNDTLTGIMPIPFYGAPGDLDSQYTRALTLKYPKVGTPNPTAGLVLVDLSGPKSFILPVPKSLSEPILASVSFATNSSVAVVWTNRVQNESVFLLCGSTCKPIYQYDEPDGWLDMLRPLQFRSSGDSFFTILPKAIGSDSWRQVALISKGSSETEQWKPTFITNFTNTVTEISHWDETSGLLWYVATSPEDTAIQHLYSTTLDGRVSCFSCNVTHSSGSPCLYNEASLSQRGSYMAVMCQGPQVPEIYIYSKDGRKLRNWETNDLISKFVSEKRTPTVRRLKVQVAETSLPPAQVLLLTPANADLSGAVKYPLLVHVYGGPDSFQVSEKWNLDWGASVVTRWNISLALIDGRGSGLKGNKNLFAGYRNLGTVEINDQINVTRHLQHSLGYIDPNRTCIWGWSYGGYASALALARGSSTFKCAVSVAPVTDWLYYDSIYTERYMGLPTDGDNKAGYAAAHLNTPEIALELGKRSFMLVHGTLDDNVHFQHSMMLSKTLQQNDVLFTQVNYADEDHGLAGVKLHLYHSIENFLMNNLMPNSTRTK